MDCTCVLIYRSERGFLPNWQTRFFLFSINARAIVCYMTRNISELKMAALLCPCSSALLRSDGVRENIYFSQVDLEMNFGQMKDQWGLWHMNPVRIYGQRYLNPYQTTKKEVVQRLHTREFPDLVSSFCHLFICYHDVDGHTCQRGSLCWRSY